MPIASGGRFRPSADSPVQAGYEIRAVALRVAQSDRIGVMLACLSIATRACLVCAAVASANQLRAINPAPSRLNQTDARQLDRPLSTPPPPASSTTELQHWLETPVDPPSGF